MPLRCSRRTCPGDLADRLTTQLRTSLVGRLVDRSFDINHIGHLVIEKPVGIQRIEDATLAELTETDVQFEQFLAECQYVVKLVPIEPLAESQAAPVRGVAKIKQVVGVDEGGRP